MDLLDLLPPEHVIVPLQATDVHAGIMELVYQLQHSGVVQDPAAIEERVHAAPDRDRVHVTEGVLLSHYRTDQVEQLAVALGIAPQPLEGELEGETRVVALVLAPAEAATLYLQVWSTLARLFRQPGFTDDLIGQPDAAAVRAMPQLQDQPIQHSLMVRDVMDHRVYSVDPDANLRRVLNLMFRRALRAVPVIGEGGGVLGIVTEADVMRTLLPTIPRAGDEEELDGEAPQERPVREIMSRSVLCVSEELGVREAASMMINKDVEQLPVVDDGFITGMVHRRDIIRKLFGRS